MLLAQAQEAGVVLHEDQQDFLADRLEEMEDCDYLWLQTTSNFKADHVDAYDSDCDDKATASAIFMASLSLAGSLNDDTVAPTYDLDIFSEIEYTENSISNNDSYDELTSDNNVISYVDYMVTIENDDAQYVPPLAKDNSMIFELERYKEKVKRLEAKYISKDFLTKREEFLDSEMQEIIVDHNKKVEAFEKKRSFNDNELRPYLK
ncbi:hypothetical protein Tco_1384845 [Tanacetum coccineum]